MSNTEDLLFCGRHSKLRAENDEPFHSKYERRLQASVKRSISRCMAIVCSEIVARHVVSRTPTFALSLQLAALMLPSTIEIGLQLLLLEFSLLTPANGLHDPPKWIITSSATY